jgi:Pretoxin HINT domain
MISNRRVLWRTIPVVGLWLFACGGTSLRSGTELEGSDPGGNSATGAAEPGGNNSGGIAGNAGYGGSSGGIVGIGGAVGGFGNTSCFEAGSLVATPGGSVPIERLRIGDQVLAFDERAGSVTPRRVTATFVHQVPESGRLALADGRVLRVTAEHPIYDAGRGAYVRADDFDGDETLVTLVQTLTPGETNSAIAGKATSPSLGLANSDARGFTRLAANGSVTVYNISVEGLENYFVESVLVHNKSGSGNNTCLPTPPPWTAGECKSQSSCIRPDAPELDDVRLNDPVESAAGGASGSAGAGGESSSSETSPPVSVSLCAGAQLEGLALLALDYRMPETQDGNPGFALYMGAPCSGTQLGEVWLNDYEPPALGSLTTQCVYLPLASLPSNLSVHSLHAGGEVTNLRFVSSCACQRELRYTTSCGPSVARQCVNAQ